MTLPTLQPLFVLALNAAALSACGSAEEAQPTTEAPSPIQIVRGAPQPAKPPAMPKGSCSAFDLMNVIGQPYTQSVAEQARQSSKAQSVLVLNIGEVAPTLPDGNRLTLELNANETITDARCG